jgi:hypothetical protein
VPVPDLSFSVSRRDSRSLFLISKRLNVDIGTVDFGQGFQSVNHAILNIVDII